MGTISLTYNGGLTSLNLHDFIILMTLLIGTSGYNEIQMILPIGTSMYNIRYTSEYILKLQKHQHLVLGIYTYVGPRYCCNSNQHKIQEITEEISTKLWGDILEKL